MNDQPGIAEVLAALATTWPSASQHRLGPVTLRDGAGGGQRVSAATVDPDFTEADLDRAEAAMREAGQPPLFMIRPGEDRLDARLAARGLAIRDPVTVHAAPVATLARRRPPPVTTFEVWPPLAVQAEIWAEGGTGPARLAIMERVTGPRTTLLGRLGDRPAGTAFAALSGRIAMLHALEVRPDRRRQGLGGHLLTAAAFWAQDQGAMVLALMGLDANTAAAGLYARAGMEPLFSYHYRVAPG